ncbi:hypothetical protein [Ancylobacter sp.]|uniref:hypothetical protein n=1 Tax=Ancylobacter sp. TaxID=1872567 RepID=UPI003BA91FB4
MKRIKVNTQTSTACEPVREQFLALMRMVAFARNDAAALGADFPAYCLDVAVSALLSELRTRETSTRSEGAMEVRCDG